MEEPPNSSSSETDLTDSWTFINNEDSERENSKADTEETSDSESLEVLDVEQAENEQNFAEGDQIRREENYRGETCTTNNSECSNVADVPIHHITPRKVRKYVHHPNPYINMWLSVVMVIAIAITLGLGVGHYLGSKRFSKAKDIIHHLRYEKEMLGQELTQVITKHKYCERSLQERDNMYGNLMNDSNEEVCLAEERTDNRSFKELILNEIPPVFSQCFSHFNGSYIGHVCPTNMTYFISKLIQGDASVVDLCSLFSNVGTRPNSIQTETLFSKLKSDLTILHFFISKWNNFMDENVKVHAAIYKDEHLVRQLQSSVQLPNKIAHINVSQINGSSVNVPNVSNRKNIVVSFNSCYRTGPKQCSLQRNKCEHKAATCKTSQSTQMFFALLQADLHKPNKFCIGMSQKAHGNNAQRLQVPKLPFMKTRKSADGLVIPVSKYRNVMPSQVHTKESKLAFPESRKDYVYHKFKKFSSSSRQKYFENNRHFSDNRNKGEPISKAIKLCKDILNKFKRFSSNKEKTEHYKYKQFFKRQKAKDEEKHYSRKTIQRDSFKLLQNFKNMHPKLFKKACKQYQKYDKDFLKNKDKMRKYFNAEKEYFSKSKCTKNKCKNHIKPCTHNREKETCRFPNPKRKNSEYHSRRIDSKVSFSLPHSHKNKNYDGKKNTSENKFYLQHASRVRRGEKFAQNQWKERNKMYQVSMQSMKVFKS